MMCYIKKIALCLALISGSFCVAQNATSNKSAVQNQGTKNTTSSKNTTQDPTSKTEISTEGEDDTEVEDSEEDVNEFDDLLFADDMDDIFNDAEDTEISDEEATKQEQQNTVSNLTFKKFTYSGFVTASAGYIKEIQPEDDDKPCAEFEVHLNGVLRPDKILTVKSEVAVAFPGMTIDLKTLYFDYVLYDRAYLTVGRTAMKWGNARIFDSDILDDGINTLETNASVLTTIKTEASQQFDVILTIPIVRGQFQTLAMYYPFSTTVARDDVCYAASIEYPIGPLSFNLFGRTWAKTDTNKMDPCFGLQISGDLFGFQFGAWGKANISRSDDYQATYAKAIISIARSWEFPKIGFAIEYQHTYNALTVDIENDVLHSNAIAWSWTWRRMFGTQFAPAFQGFVDIENKCGAVIPGLSFTGLPLITLTFIAPVFYGNQHDIEYNKINVDSTAGQKTVLLGLILRLNVGF